MKINSISDESDEVMKVGAPGSMEAWKPPGVIEQRGRGETNKPGDGGRITISQLLKSRNTYTSMHIQNTNIAIIADAVHRSLTDCRSLQSLLESDSP